LVGAQEISRYLRSDNGPEFTARAVRHWLSRIGVRTLYIEPDSPWENGYLESFNGKLRQEKLNGEIFYTLREAQVLIEQWRLEYNTLRPHSSLNYPPRHQKPGCTEGTSSGGTLTLGAGQRLRTILIRIAQILSLTFVFLINAHLKDSS
jgi:transposase InsO family protein